MIKNILIKNPNQTPVSWWPDVFPNVKEITFTPGLNIIIGPNGSGKSTLLLLLRRYFHCEYGYYSMLTKESIDKIGKNCNGVDIIHDGQVVFNCDSSITVGVRGGNFDDNFFSEGIRAIGMERLSQGQQNIFKWNAMIHYIEDEKINTIKDELKREIEDNKINDIWQEYYKSATRIIYSPQIEKGKKTILLDGPDKGFDCDKQYDFWQKIIKRAQNFQIIIATHSIFALQKFKIDANYYETKPGYIKNMKKLLNKIK